MPCGGIFPIAQHYSGRLDATAGEFGWNTAVTHDCLVCHQPVDRLLDLFCEEFDTYVHRACVGQYLCMDAGRTVLAHGHPIMVPARDDERRHPDEPKEGARP